MLKKLKNKLDKIFDVSSLRYKVNKWILRVRRMLMILLFLVVDWSDYVPNHETHHRRDAHVDSVVFEKHVNSIVVEVMKTQFPKSDFVEPLNDVYVGVGNVEENKK